MQIITKGFARNDTACNRNVYKISVVWKVENSQRCLSTARKEKLPVVISWARGQQ